MVQPWRFDEMCSSLLATGLLTPQEAELARHVVSSKFRLHPVIARAHSWHLHVHLEPNSRVPPSLATLLGADKVFDRDGFMEFECAGAAISVSFSTRQVARQPVSATGQGRPVLDHIGFDFTAGQELLFDQAAALSRSAGWPTVAQGGDGTTVRCCFAEVLRKLWIFLPDAGADVAIELALGELSRDCASMGEDLRPARPNPGSQPPSQCCS